MAGMTPLAFVFVSSTALDPSSGPGIIQDVLNTQHRTVGCDVWIGGIPQPAQQGNNLKLSQDSTHSIPQAERAYGNVSWDPARAVGLLNGISPFTPMARVQQLAPHTVRLPNWTPAQLSQLTKLGVQSLQIILGPQILEHAAEERGINISALRTACRSDAITPLCPLPGSVGDPHMLGWDAAVNATVAQLVPLRASGIPVVYDIYNEPNFVGGPGTGGGGWMFPSKYYTPPQGAPSWTTFWEVWNRAVRLIRSRDPAAVIVGPSVAPGPGLPEGDPVGWLPQKQWLQAFLLQASANGTLPDLLSWHDYTGVPAMAASMQQELRMWMSENNLPQLPMGYNEIVDSAHAQSAGYHVATAAALQQVRADHAVLGCWGEPGPATAAPISTCWDGSLDGLVDPTQNFSTRPVYWSMVWLAALPREVKTVLSTDGPSNCHLGGLGGRRSAQDDGTFTALLGRWGSPTTSEVVLHIAPFGETRTISLEVLPGCPSLDTTCPVYTPSAPAFLAHVPAGEWANVTIHLSEAEAARVVAVITHNTTTRHT